MQIQAVIVCRKFMSHSTLIWYVDNSAHSVWRHINQSSQYFVYQCDQHSLPGLNVIMQNINVPGTAAQSISYLICGLAENILNLWAPQFKLTTATTWSGRSANVSTELHLWDQRMSHSFAMHDDKSIASNRANKVEGGHLSILCNPNRLTPFQMAGGYR